MYNLLSREIYTHTLAICFLFLCHNNTAAQSAGTQDDSARNNLVLPAGYQTSEYGSVPEYSKAGSGKQIMLLIPGWGFDGSVFDDFAEKNKDIYTMYVITIPGYGNTKAPPLLRADTSYGSQSWNKSILAGLSKLIEKEKLHDIVVVGHFVQGTQLALSLAIEQGPNVKRVIIMGGPAKFIVIDKGVAKEYPLKSLIYYIDHFWAPNWFGKISKADFDHGNYLPEIYSNDSLRAITLWKQSANQNLAVMIKYLCEFYVSGITEELNKIQCPVLVLRATFTPSVLAATVNNYVHPQFIHSWDDAVGKNPLIKIANIPGAACFIWKDKPEETYRLIKEFITNH